MELFNALIKTEICQKDDIEYLTIRLQMTDGNRRPEGYSCRYFVFLDTKPLCSVKKILNNGIYHVESIIQTQELFRSFREFSAPEIYGTYLGNDGYFYIIEEFIDSEISLDLAIKTGVVKEEQANSIYSKLFFEINNQPILCEDSNLLISEIEGITSVLTYLPTLEKYRHVVEQLILERIEMISERAKLSSGDLIPRNILLTKNKPVIIDFDLSRKTKLFFLDIFRCSMHCGFNLKIENFIKSTEINFLKLVSNLYELSLQYKILNKSRFESFLYMLFENINELNTYLPQNEQIIFNKLIKENIKHFSQLNVNSFDSKVIKTESNLYLDFGDGYNKENRIKVDLDYSDINDSYHLLFNIKDWKKKNLKDGMIYRIRWDPVEGYYCKCEVINFKSNGKIDKIEPINSSKEIDGQYEFMTKDPNFEVIGDFTNLSYIALEIKLNLLDLNYVTKYFEHKCQEQYQVINDQNAIIQETIIENIKLRNKIEYFNDIIGGNMLFDIIIVTYNSSQWIDACLESIKESKYDLKKISVIIVDNNSTDDTLEKLNQNNEKNKNTFKKFEIIKSRKNLGFGKANNIGFKKGTSPYVFFLNVDTELEKNALKELSIDIENSEEDIAIWEARQFPYEHPKYYNPITSYTSWASGAAFVIKRNIFEQVNGFDNRIFMYAEDVDLSWRVRALGYKIKYVPKSIIYHYCYKDANEVKPIQYYNSIINNILLRYRFGSLKDIIKGYFMFFGLLTYKGPFANSRKVLLKELIKKHMLIPHFFRWRLFRTNKSCNFCPKFVGWDYEIIREGAFYINELPKESPKVSIIVRTCNRPNVLKEALISIKNQTYKNIEIVVVEDGENKAEKMIKEEFSDLNINYYCTKEKVGRSKAGNIGLERSTGLYLNFLDDDDVFFADHVEVLVNQLEKNPQYKIAYSLAYETPIQIKRNDPYIYTEVYHNLIYKQPFNRLRLCFSNYIPIQCVMFSKSIFLEEGGFDEKLDYLEDWDLWLRYSLKNDFYYIPKVTSMYRVPYNVNIGMERQSKLNDAYEQVRKKHENYIIHTNAAEVGKDIQNLLDAQAIVISREIFAKFEARMPLVTKIIKRFKNKFNKQKLKRILNWS